VSGLHACRVHHRRHGLNKISLRRDTGARSVRRSGCFATAKLLAADVRCVLVHVTPGLSATRQNGVVQLLRFGKGYPSRRGSRQSRPPCIEDSQPGKARCTRLDDEFEKFRVDARGARDEQAPTLLFTRKPGDYRAGFTRNECAGGVIPRR